MSKQRPVKFRTPTTRNDDVGLDYITPYPCCVCGKFFQSRNTLATHKHPKKES